MTENKEREKRTSTTQLNSMREEIIFQFIHEINRVLVPSGHLFLWVDKFHLCQSVLDWFKGTSS